MSTYHTNPPRGCGSKQPDAYYLESGDFTPNGALHAWTWCLGDGIDDIAPIQVPPRTVVSCNPAASIAEGALTRSPYEPAAWNEDLYHKLLNGLPDHGLADHVGANHYSAYSFAQEVEARGPSRRIPPNQARALGLYIHQNGPIPILFTHSRVPVFRNVEEVYTASKLVYDCYNIDASEYPVKEASWRVDNWGAYARKNQDKTLDHFMIPVLRMVETLDMNWGRVQGLEPWEEAREFFGQVRFVEQTVGVSWICRVSYTLPRDEEEMDKLAREIPGLFVIDLKEKA